MSNTLPSSSGLSLLESLNRELFLAINAVPDTPTWLLDAARFIASVPLFLLPLALLGLWCWGDCRLRGALLRALAVTLLALLLSQAIGLLWPHPRPFAIGLGHAWTAHAANASFPSDHLTLFAGVALSLLFDEAYLIGALLGLGGLAVGYARVYLGIHFPLDMLGALAVAAVSNSLVWLLWQRLGDALTALAEGLYRRWLAPAISRGWLRY
ncbi:phosphatase PAP2 family protein [Pseudomonas citronellolis]|uniref:phosphatase PAP2 family protein n=1 Tax=Pseudomonas citronellolis TaxID=53408 RepID=UPI0023E3AA47|nr:phosphatase PAP2 family protein [Pseudomonas citronellolis]MDF3932721.1 phosphatase PAP2 family protein [Pseudomonas citronellolis]